MADLTCPSEYIALAHRLADASGEVLRRYFRQSIEVEGKDDHSPVTVADRETEQTLRAMIEAAYPAHGIQGEEFGSTNGKAEYIWTLDPIDGTRAFVCGKPLFGTLIALLQDGIPILGIIDQPILRERWIGAAGHPTQVNGKECRTRSCPSLAQAVVNIASKAFMEKFAATLPSFRIIENAALSFSIGGDCYSYGLLASGLIDVAIEHDLDIDDFAPLVPIIEGAGGMITDWQGKALGPRSDGHILAAGDKRVGQEALALLKETA